MVQAEASSHTRAGWAWLCSALGCGGLIAWYTVARFEPTILDLMKATPAPSQTAIHTMIISRVVLMSLLSFALVWMARNYRASRHNAVVNRHRENDLKTFRAFVEGPQDDPQVRNAILLQASQSIFAPQTSGYI